MGSPSIATTCNYIHPPRLTTKRRLLLSCILSSPLTRQYNCTSITDSAYASSFFNVFSIISPIPLLHFCNSPFLLSHLSPTFCKHPSTSYGINIARNFRIQLFQISTGLLFNLPHLSFLNFNYVHRSGSFLSTHNANSRLNLLISSSAQSYSAAIVA